MANKASAKKKSAEPPGGDGVVCRNRHATRRYDVLEKFEAGLVLSGSEVKSLRLRHGDIEGAYAALRGDEVFLHQMHVGPYEQANVFAHETKRSRKLLLHRREIEKLRGRLTMRGLALVPLQVYFKNGFAKVELGLATGKKDHDRRQQLKEQEANREAQAAMRQKR